mgnify:CR=1 FL=1
MKKSKYKSIEQGIKKTTLLGSTIIIFIVATIIGSLLIKTEYNNFKSHIKNFRKTLIEREKFQIKTAVENLKQDISFEELSILNSKKSRIKNQSVIAYNLAYSLYQKTKNLSKEKQINFIKSSVKQMAQKQNDINYFILDTKGTYILNSSNPQNEGEVFLDFEDINGIKFINEMINANQEQQNFLEYFWFKPSKKITYSRHLKELGIIIGSGSFLETNNIELKDKIIQKIFNQNFNIEEFLFLYKINSLNNITTQSELLTQKHIIPGPNELNAIKELLIDNHYKGNNYIVYENYQKLLYGSYITHLRYFIGVGVNLSAINKIVQKETKISMDNMYSNIIQLITIITIMTLIFFILSLLFTKRVEKIFKRYKKNVILNEQKYKLLFNHSNDAFIISEITKDKKAKIISWNKTASKVSFYEDNELLDKNLFDLFFDLTLDQILKDHAFFKTVKMTTKNGDIKTIELNAIVYAHEHQELLFTSLRDITERTLLKEEKQNQEKILIQKSKMAAMGEMIGNIAHQWRQPLSQVSGLFFDIESAYDYKELNKKYLHNRVEEANDLIEYMSKTIDDFRNFFNPNTKKELFLIQDAVNNAVKIINSTLKFHKIELTINCDESFKIDGYKNEYSQAVLNIISNAKDILIDKKIAHPQIKIYMDENALHIEDNAGGIDNDIINKIFDPYFTTKYEYGTGIGLYMTKLIIENKMNGHISVKNSTHGAIFTIKI